VRTLSFMLRIGLGPLVGLSGGALTLLALARALPLRVGVDLESDRPRSVSIVVFPAERDSAQPMPSQVLEANVRRTIACELHPNVRALALELGTDPGRVLVRAIRIGRILRWAAWSGAELDQWKQRTGIDRAAANGGELELELSGVETARLAHVAVAAALKAGARREQTMLGIAGALLGVAVALRPALRAWRVGSSNQRKLAVAYAGLSILLVGLSAVAGKRVLAHGKRSGYQDPTGDYDFSFLDHSGRRVSHQIGQLGLVLDPFCFYRNYPRQGNASLSVDENGFRGGMPDSDDPLLFLVGGSAVFGYGLSSDDQTISARLTTHLGGYGSVNAGASGYVSGQELALMVCHLDRWRPAAYVALDGWNDLLEAVYYPKNDPSSASLPVLAVNGQYFSLEQRLHEHARSTYDGELPAWPFPSLTVQRSLETRFQEALELYVANVERMATWARSRGAVFLVVLQPDKGAKHSLTESERATSTTPADLSASYRRFVEAATERFAALGIPHASLLDHPAIVDSSDTLFMDPCHLTPNGCDLVARLLAEQIAPLLPSAASLRSQ
jgi:hypothetical protein